MNDYAMYGPIRIGSFDPEKLREESLEEELEQIYKMYLEPIMNEGLDFICKQKHFMNYHDDLTRPNSLEYLKKYKEEHNIKTSKKMIYTD